MKVTSASADKSARQLRRLRQECLSGKLIAASWNLWSHYFLLRPYACEGEGWRRGKREPVLEKDTSTFHDPAEKTRCDSKCANFCPSVLKVVNLKRFQPVLCNQLASFFTVMKAGSDGCKLHLKSTEEEKEEGKMWKRFFFCLISNLAFVKHCGASRLLIDINLTGPLLKPRTDAFAFQFFFVKTFCKQIDTWNKSSKFVKKSAISCVGLQSGSTCGCSCVLASGGSN